MDVRDIRMELEETQKSFKKLVPELRKSLPDKVKKEEHLGTP